MKEKGRKRKQKRVVQVADLEQAVARAKSLRFDLRDRIRCASCISPRRFFSSNEHLAAHYTIKHPIPSGFNILVYAKGKSKAESKKRNGKRAHGDGSVDPIGSSASADASDGPAIKKKKRLQIKMNTDHGIGVKRGRGRPRKARQDKSEGVEEVDDGNKSVGAEVKIIKKRGRPKKSEAEVKMVKKRGRPKKSEDEVKIIKKRGRPKKSEAEPKPKQKAAGGHSSTKMEEPAEPAAEGGFFTCPVTGRRYRSKIDMLIHSSRSLHLQKYSSGQSQPAMREREQ